MYDSVLETARKIKELKIQGAKNIAEESMKAILAVAGEKDFMKKREDVALALITRQTEPLQFNLLHAVLQAETADQVVRIARNGIKYVEGSSARIEKAGIEAVPDGGTVMTHCHSSTVTGILKLARQEKEFSVIATETRPRFQGRTTAKELQEAGIQTTLIVDSAANYFMPSADMLIVGGDALTKFGLVNKIGTSQLALSAKHHSVPVYSAISLLKVSERIIIEERSADELGEKLGVRIRNPAFDLTRTEFISGFITELGIIEASRAYDQGIKEIKNLANVVL